MSDVGGFIADMARRQRKGETFETAKGFLGIFSFTPAPIGLTTPVIASATSQYSINGRMVSYFGTLDITSWAGQAGFIRVTLPVTTTMLTGTIGSMSYYRAGGSTNGGSVTAVFATGPYLAFHNATASDSAPWEASARVILSWGIAYLF